jgi:hypothetical protein
MTHSKSESVRVLFPLLAKRELMHLQKAEISLPKGGHSAVDAAQHGSDNPTASARGTR